MATPPQWGAQLAWRIRSCIRLTASFAISSSEGCRYNADLDSSPAHRRRTCPARAPLPANVQSVWGKWTATPHTFALDEVVRESRVPDGLRS